MRTILLRLGIGLAVILLSTGAYYGYTIVKFSMDIHEKPETSNLKPLTHDPEGKTSTPVVYTPPSWEGSERVNILLLGGDSRGLRKNEVPRSDTILILSIDPQTKQAALFSILRDTYVSIPGFGHNRINAALAYGGPDLAMKTVNDLTGLSIQYYVYVDFQGFIQLIDALGGIDYNVEKDMDYTSKADGPEYSIHLKKGMQHLDGNQALQYVRFRHDARSDYARTERQRQFLKAVADKVKSSSSLIKLPSILNKIEPYINTNLGLGTLIRLGSLGYHIDSDQAKTIQLPPDTLLKEEKVSGSDVIGVNPQQLRSYIQDVLQKQKKAATADDPSIDTTASNFIQKGDMQ